MEEGKGLKRLLSQLEEKLEYTRRLIAEYDEAMDYASQCNLQGFAQGIAFAIDEIREALGPDKGTGKAVKKGNSQRTPVSAGAKSLRHGKTKDRKKRNGRTSEADP